jgi:hypothetical protein
MKKVLVSLALAASFCSYSQEAIPATGGEATGSGGSSSFTVGQIAYTTNSASNGSASQGVQQTYEIIDNSGIQDTNFSLEVKTYPNPTTDKIQLQIADMEGKDLSYILTDVQGKQILSDKITSTTTELDLNTYADGTYLLKVINTNKEIKTYKIIKH